MELTEARAEFPGLEDKAFLDAACVSLIPRSAYDGIRAFLDMALTCPAADASLHHIAMDALRREAIEEASALLRVPARRIALVESTTHALNIAANAIPLVKGDEVLIADTEFLQVAIPWAKKADEPGVVITPVRSGDDGVLAFADFERAVTPRTRAICVSSVQWCSGCRVDVRALGELCAAKGIWLVVDAIQEMGALDIDLSQTRADFVMAGGHKWLNAPHGCGVLALSERALAELDPPSWGYLALEEPAGGWGEYFRTPSITPYREYRFPRTAKSFEIAGTSNYPGAVGLGRSLALVNRVGIAKAEAQVLRLAGLLQGDLARLGLHVVSRSEPGIRSGITVFRAFPGAAENLALLERLLADRIFVAMRYTSQVGGIRVSTHYFNNEEDLERLLWSLGRHLPASSRRG
jgi:selenocysteine lyase/cysteine desulfurase